MANQLTPNNPLVQEIRELVKNARTSVAQQVNTQLLSTYWQIGRAIVEYEQQNQLRAEYGKQTLKELAKELTRELGKGFSRSNLQNMRAFYLAYEKCQTVSGKLSWSHYCELLSISDANKRSFYEKEAVNSNWSVRELKRQIDSSLYERLLLSNGDANKEKVLSLAQKGIEINQPADIIRDPYVFEFLGVPENKPMLEEGSGSADRKVPAGAGARFYVCGNTAARYIKQYPLLCGHGVLQQNPAGVCFD